ncbi:MAG: hypothetical protein IPO48_06340 [Saprospiraceae bacterium]|nr:hypothetical protein [Saprospiraceae bacterium]
MWDEARNFDFCTVKIIIQKNTACSGTNNLVKISGNVFNTKNEMIGNVQVDLINQENFEQYKDMTNTAGSYQFGDMHQDEYMIKPQKNDDHLNGVSTLDLVLIQRHILGLQPFLDPYLFYAADINKDGRITASDLVELRKLILGIYSDFPKNTSWRFFEAKMIPNANSFPNGINEFIMIDDASINMSNNDFIGVKIGDVNQSAVTNLNDGQNESRSKDNWLYINNNNIMEGQSFNIPAIASQSIVTNGFQMSFKISEKDVRFVKLISDVIDLKSEHYHFDNSTGVLNISWNQNDDIHISNGQVLFNIVLESHSKSSVDQILSLDTRSISTEYYTTDLSSVKFGLEFKKISENDLAVAQNQPNPFVHSTVIPFVLLNEGNVKIKIYDSVGKVVFEKENRYNSGAHQFEVTESIVGNATVLYFEVTFAGKSTTKKMIHLTK